MVTEILNKKQPLAQLDSFVTKTYKCLDDGFLVDIVKYPATLTEDGAYEAWLYHKDYTKKINYYRVLSKEVEYEEDFLFEAGRRCKKVIAEYRNHVMNEDQTQLKTTFTDKLRGLFTKAS